MSYVDHINSLLRPVSNEASPLVLDLFAGCGGLSLGFEANGFRTEGYEMNPQACNTYNRNLMGECFEAKLEVGFNYNSEKYDIIVGGPPCQPFSVGGYQKGKEDSRNGFPIFIDSVARFKPEMWLFENVRGMLYSNREYFLRIVNELCDLGYHISYRLVNAVNYGVPQNRERVLVVGSRLPIEIPEVKLEYVKVEDAIGDLIEIIQDDSKILTESMDRYILKYEIASKCINPRDLYLDRPARTLTCRNIAAPTGDMIRVKLQDGRRRRISVREAARIQSFPDWFKFSGTETEQYYQIGNAVPPLLSYNVAKLVKAFLYQNLPTRDSIKYNAL